MIYILEFGSVDRDKQNCVVQQNQALFILFNVDYLFYFSQF